MAKQVSHIKLVGTFGDITFYQMDGVYYARRKSSLTAGRVRRDPCFRRTMQLATIFGTASAVASQVYRCLPPTLRFRQLRYALIRQARRMLEQGYSRQHVTRRLMADYLPGQTTGRTPAKKCNKDRACAHDAGEKQCRLPQTGTAPPHPHPHTIPGHASSRAAPP